MCLSPSLQMYPQRPRKKCNRSVGYVAQSVICLTADPGVASSILARSHTFVEIDHEIISTAILLPSADSRIQAKVCARSAG